MTAPLPNDQTGQVRTVGSNYTMFTWNGSPIAYLESITDSGQAPFANNGRGFEFIHPLGYVAPTDIVTTRALDGGTLELSIRELWNLEVWQHLSLLANAHDIVEVFRALARTPQYITCTKVISPPNGVRRGKVYHRCVVVGIEDGDTVSIGALSIAKRIQIAYTHTTKL
jgi:hypothetical protein